MSSKVHSIHHTPPVSATAQEQPEKLATINIHNLRLRTLIGFNPEERQKQQDVVVNAEIRYVLSAGALRDEIDDALNYKVITKKIIGHIESGQFLLLEKLVGDVLDICLEPEPVRFAEVKIEKPHALRFADSVSLTISSVRNPGQTAN